MNRHLMIIDSQEEYDFALQLRDEINDANFNGDFWLGGTDRVTEGEWVWNWNGEPMNMEVFWKSNQPSSVVPEEKDCIYMTRHGFYDDSCGDYRTFVCEFN